MSYSPPAHADLIKTNLTIGRKWHMMDYNLTSASACRLWSRLNSCGIIARHFYRQYCTATIRIWLEMACWIQNILYPFVILCNSTCVWYARTFNLNFCHIYRRTAESDELIRMNWYGHNITAIPSSRKTDEINQLEKLLLDLAFPQIRIMSSWNHHSKALRSINFVYT
jgi:hypothetical protein